jgi:SAM-dependent methyltransferase
MRAIDPQEYCHDRLGEQFALYLSDFDTSRRAEVLIDDFLAGKDVCGKRALDVGCGLGFFSARLKERGADVTACDLGPAMVALTRARVGCPSVVADALRLAEQFGPDAFDIVVSSECIEHTPAPAEALRQMARVLRPGGWLAVSTPNVVWSPVVKLATWLGLRPFDGYEHFSTWGGLRRTLTRSGIEVVREYGVHLIPFQLKLYSLSRWLDRHAQWARPVMINLCVLGRKGLPAPAQGEP